MPHAVSRAVINRMLMSYTLREGKRVPVWFASVAFVVMLAGCTQPTQTVEVPVTVEVTREVPVTVSVDRPTVSPELLKIEAIETQMQAACDDFIRQQATLAAEGHYEYEGTISSDELPDLALSLQVERAYSDALGVFDGMDSDSPDADAVRAMIARIAPMQRHAANWVDAFAGTADMIINEEITEDDVLTIGPLPEWRIRFVEMCADW